MAGQVVAAGDIDVDFLPIIYQYLRCLEKEQPDLGRVSQESSLKVLELQRKIQTAREQVRKLPGVEYSREEQLRRLEALRKQLALKKHLLLKYKAKSEVQH
ncbi:mediator of RNA polymerase II transcription subunit 9-like [Portunus trituberculatus]|uniref:mediator of RNA polymerase II transcription subunit 9-like n=1 Tax=Portunus trituberculatus TaxID=210409 RepID=UPI001E1D1C52|nr:mediator of RNA polymerase II transcription subunit 9-like [Portunus trituberculatus]